MPVVLIGNEHPKQSRGRDEDDNPVFEPSPGPSVLTVNVPDEYSLSEGFLAITNGNSVWVNHSYDDKPTWVRCEDSPGLEALLAEHFKCTVGVPDDLEETHHTYNGAPTKGKAK